MISRRAAGFWSKLLAIKRSGFDRELGEVYMRTGKVGLASFLVSFTLAVSAFAQFGHPLTGTWSGDWGPSKTNRQRLLVQQERRTSPGQTLSPNGTASAAAPRTRSTSPKSPSSSPTQTPAEPRRLRGRQSCLSLGCADPRLAFSSSRFCL